VTILADTSIWVAYLRKGTRGPGGALDGLLQRGDVVLCGPVAAEVLAGSPPGQRDELWILLNGLPWAEFGRAQWQRVGEVAGDLRARGASVPLTDIEIAVAAVDSGARLWTHEADFGRIGTVLKGLRRFLPSP